MTLCQFLNGIKFHKKKLNMNNKIKQTSKFLSLLLRHQPDTIGLTLDGSGWANIKELIMLSNENKQTIDLSLIQQVVATNDKQRFSISEDGQFIRANQGHSISVDLELEPVLPPSILFHGTATRFVDSIFEQGLTKSKRQHVHLSATKETAITVGQRHGKPAILMVAAQQMHEQGYLFFQSKNGVWLTDHIPVNFLTKEENNEH